MVVGMLRSGIEPLPAEARPGSASCHVATVSHDSSSSAMRCVRPPLKLYSTAAPTVVVCAAHTKCTLYSTWCRHTPSECTWHTAVMYSLRACTRHTRTRSPNNEKRSINQCDGCRNAVFWHFSINQCDGCRNTCRNAALCHRALCFDFQLWSENSKVACSKSAVPLELANPRNWNSSKSKGQTRVRGEWHVSRVLHNKIPYGTYLFTTTTKFLIRFLFKACSCFLLFLREMCVFENIRKLMYK